ncbi:ParB N-terminal domain-containing protein [Nonomuraea angiospora]|uniref:ParB N-terminal domain-containing protein n=1 Tax=Nonomuraea angiospora TaxID=46172 RepID=UPI00344F1028
MWIIAGEHRWRGAKTDGLDDVPALVIDDTATRSCSRITGPPSSARTATRCLPSCCAASTTSTAPAGPTTT